jgi:glutaminyl-peptide cyclotransferase
MANHKILIGNLSRRLGPGLQILDQGLSRRPMLVYLVMGVLLTFDIGRGLSMARGVVQNQSSRAESASEVGRPAKSGSAQEKNRITEPAEDFDKDAAFEFLKKIVAIGPRVSASAGMQSQIEFLEEHFQSLEAQVYRQEFSAIDPSKGTPAQLTNLIVRWHPERTKRLLFCCHYDTRPFPDADRQNPQGIFLGANDGGSGVAVLCELGKHMAALDGKYGIDFVFFDAEEFVYVYQRDPMFLGSRHFAEQYRQRTAKWKYEFGILLDMVGDADLQIYMEGNSQKYAGRLTRSVWAVAKNIGVEEFIPKQRHTIRDDHLPLNEIAKIETTNIIDFDFPNPTVGNIYWHTQQDSIENCSAESLGKVGRVVLAWVRQMQELNRLK